MTRWILCVCLLAGCHANIVNPTPVDPPKPEPIKITLCREVYHPQINTVIGIGLILITPAWTETICEEVTI